jgi:hypothetical protein
MDIKSKTCDIWTREKHLFLGTSSTITDTLYIGLYLPSNTTTKILVHSLTYRCASLSVLVSELISLLLCLTVNKVQYIVLIHNRMHSIKIIKTDTLAPSLYQCVETRSIEVFWLLSQPLPRLRFNLFVISETFATQLWTALRDKHYPP